MVEDSVIAAYPTRVMLRIFLGNWRSALIVAVSIRLAILCSIIIFSALGETINIVRQVEENLAGLRILEREAETQQRAVVASQKSLGLSLTRYVG